jgi:phosphopantothenoylcysteine synthetase/decarboxylase
LIADEFIRNGHMVTYVAPISVVLPAVGYAGQYDFRQVTDTYSVLATMEDLVPNMDVVVQCMAISDFTFDRSKPIKINNQDLDGFIDYMRQTITKTPNIISYYRDWNPSAILVGFKFTVGKSKEELKEIAKQLMETNKLDMVFANDKFQMQAKGAHVGCLIMEEWEEYLKGKDEIAERIYINVVRKVGK